MNGDRWGLRDAIVIPLLERYGTHPQEEREVYIATSGGVDSSALAVAVMETDAEPIITSFTLDDRESTDFLGARKLAEHFGLKFVPVFVPTDEDMVVKLVLENMQRYRLRKKADIECLYPIIYMIKHIAGMGATNLMMGHGADGHFCLSKKGMIHFRHSIETLQMYRQQHYQTGPLGQRKLYYKICNDFNIQYHDPFWNKEIYEIFFNCSWEEINKPRQKEPLRAAFPELDFLKIRNHTNLQLGDSGIADVVGKSMQLRFAPNSKSPISAYNNAVRRGLVEA
jgi:asparagine synthetase B (glutamine-hydrolysing)